MKTGELIAGGVLIVVGAATLEIPFLGAFLVGAGGSLVASGLLGSSDSGVDVREPEGPSGGSGGPPRHPAAGAARAAEHEDVDADADRQRRCSRRAA